MNQKLRVVFVSPEVSPFAKSGEMADVAAALPKYLASMGLDVSLFLPKYRRPEIESMPVELVEPELMVPLGGDRIKATVYRSEPGKYSLYLVDNPKYFWREKIYGSSKGEYLDNDERFIFFNRAVLEFLLKTGTAPDIIHCNNWPSALIPVFLRTHYASSPVFKKTATVFTLHNIAFQGQFPPETLALTELNWNYFNPRQLSFNGRFNFLKAALMFSDVVNTVSSAYKREIQTKKHGFGLGEILRSGKGRLFSIRNGVDYETWNPETDPYIVSNFSLARMGGKKDCKRDLIREFGLAISDEMPVAGIVSYFTLHKGFDILIEAMDEAVGMGLSLVLLGQGDEKYESRLEAVQKKYPGRVAVRLEMNPSLSHKVAAGSDISIIPSLHEPCGLNQLYSFRYGTVPVVRATGGLKETVRPFNPRMLKGNGFVFKEFSSRALLGALKEALDCYGRPNLWRKIMEAGFRENFSWEIAAGRYLRLYRKALDLRRGETIDKQH